MSSVLTLCNVVLKSSCEILLFTPMRLVSVKETNSWQQAASVQRSQVTDIRLNSTSYVEVRTLEIKAVAPELRSPVLCPLSAGIGRTGCFIVSSIGCQQLRETGQVDILETVCQLRLDRWVSTVLSDSRSFFTSESLTCCRSFVLHRGGMIQTTEQYQFLYSTLAQYSSQLQLSQVPAEICVPFKSNHSDMRVMCLIPACHKNNQ